MHRIECVNICSPKKDEPDKMSKSPDTATSGVSGGSGTVSKESKEAEANRQRQSNLQRIQQRKQAVRMWPQDKKLEKLAIYSSCKSVISGTSGPDPCRCNGGFE